MNTHIHIDMHMNMALAISMQQISVVFCVIKTSSKNLYIQ